MFATLRQRTVEVQQAIAEGRAYTEFHGVVYDLASFDRGSAIVIVPDENGVPVGKCRFILAFDEIKFRERIGGAL